jgi:hypothetical protein
MEEFARLFGSLLTFVYHCFDRIVILGRLPLLTRPENIVHFFRNVHDQAILSSLSLAPAALLFVLFHQRVCGPLANSLFHHRTTQTHVPHSKIEAAYRKADRPLDQIIQLLAA